MVAWVIAALFVMSVPGSWVGSDNEVEHFAETYVYQHAVFQTKTECEEWLEKHMPRLESYWFSAIHDMIEEQGGKSAVQRVWCVTYPPPGGAAK